MEKQIFIKAFETFAKNNNQLIALTWGEHQNPFNHSESSFTFAQLDHYANSLASHLEKKYTFKKGQRVAICIPRSNPAWVISALAIWKCAGVILLIDSTLPTDAKEYRFKHAGIDFVIVDTDEYCSTNKRIKIIRYHQFKPTLTSTFNSPEKLKLSCNDMAYIAFTSGTTGEPKAIVISHAGIMPVINKHKEVMQLSNNDSVLQFGNFAFDASWMEFFMLSVGVKLVLPPDTQNVLQDLADLIDKNKITVLITSPSLLRSYANHNVFPSLKKIVSTGEAGIESVFNQWLEKGKRIFNGYGPTEVTIGITLSEYQRQQKITLGHVTEDIMYGSEIILLSRNKQNKTITQWQADSEHPGMIAVSGPGLMRGYLRDGKYWDEKNKTCLIEYNGKIYYLTGDLAVIENEFILFKGRKDRQLKIHGMRAEAEDLETRIHNKLKEKYDFIQACHIHAYRDLTSDEKKITHLAAVLQVENPKQIETVYKAMGVSEFRNSVHSNELPWALIPTEIYVATTKTFETTSFKFDQKQFDQNMENKDFCQKLKKLRPSVKKNSNRKITRLEKAIGKIWLNLLNITNENYLPDPVNDDFSMMGGNSLLLTELTKQLERKYEINFNSYPKLSFEKITLSKLAEQIVRKSAFEHAWLTLNERSNNRPKLFLLPPVSGSPSEFKKQFGSIQANLFGLEDPLLETTENKSQLIREYRQHYKITDITTFAHYAIYGVLKVHKDETLKLAGYSYGGVVTLAMAKILLDLNQPVTYIGLLDPPAPDFLSKNLIHDNKQLNYIVYVLAEIANAFNFKLHITTDDIAPDIKPVEKVERLFEKADNEIAKAVQIKSQKEKILSTFKTVKNNILMLADYQFAEKQIKKSKPFHFYISTEYKERKTDWKKYFLNGIKDVQILDLQINHIELLRSETLQSDINKCLADINQPLKKKLKQFKQQLNANSQFIKNILLGIIIILGILIFAFIFFGIPFRILNQRQTYSPTRIPPLNLTSCEEFIHINQKTMNCVQHEENSSCFKPLTTLPTYFECVDSSVDKRILDHNIQKKSSLNVITGTGGRGKTSYALDFANRFFYAANGKGLVWQFDARDESALNNSARMFAIELGLIDENNQDVFFPENFRHKFHMKTNAYAYCLLVFDDLKNIKLINNVNKLLEYICPKQPSEHKIILITSRNQNLCDDYFCITFNETVFNKDKQLTLLFNASGLDKTYPSQAQELLDTLKEKSPQQLQIIGAYIRKQLSLGIEADFNNYLEKLKAGFQQRLEIEKQVMSYFIGYEYTPIDTIDLSFKGLSQPAKQLISFLSLLDNKRLPMNIFSSYQHITNLDNNALANVLSELLDYSLLSKNNEGHRIYYFLHDTAQEVIIHKKLFDFTLATKVLRNLLPKNPRENSLDAIKKRFSYFNHLKRLAEWAEKFNAAEKIELAFMTSDSAFYLDHFHDIANFAIQVVTAWRNRTEHELHLIRTFDLLNKAYYSLNLPEKQFWAIENAFDIYNRSQNKTRLHEISSIFNSLATYLFKNERYKEALIPMKRALYRHKQRSEFYKDDIPVNLYNLGRLHERLNHTNTAMACYLAAIDYRYRTYSNCIDYEIADYLNFYGLMLARMNNNNAENILLHGLSLTEKLKNENLSKTYLAKQHRSLGFFYARKKPELAIQHINVSSLLFADYYDENHKEVFSLKLAIDCLQKKQTQCELLFPNDPRESDEPNQAILEKECIAENSGSYQKNCLPIQSI